MTNTPTKISVQTDGGAIVTAQLVQGWLVTCPDCPDMYAYELSKESATRVAYSHAMSHGNEYRSEAIVSMVVS